MEGKTRRTHATPERGVGAFTGVAWTRALIVGFVYQGVMSKMRFNKNTERLCFGR